MPSCCARSFWANGHIKRYGTGDRELAQDLVAEAFARACASWRKVARHPNPRAWVVRTALNVHTDRWRSRRREMLLVQPADAGMHDADPADRRNAAPCCHLAG